MNKKEKAERDRQQTEEARKWRKQTREGGRVDVIERERERERERESNDVSLLLVHNLDYWTLDRTCARINFPRSMTGGRKCIPEISG